VLHLQDGLVYDVGANNGDDTAYYLFKGYRVLAIEADPSLMDELNARFAAEVAGGQLQILNIALAPTRRVAQFYICEGYSLWNSFDREDCLAYGPHGPPGWTSNAGLCAMFSRNTACRTI